MKRIVGIQFLRALAALGVVAAHASGRFGQPWVVGVAGVDIFFVISGFMMASIVREDTNWRAFLVDRATRIVPIYWIATSAMIIGAFLKVFPSIRLSVEYVLASFLFIPMRAATSTEILPILAQGWTLNCEMFFYAIFAVGLLAKNRVARIGVLSCAALALVAVGQISDPSHDALRFWCSPLILEFVAGAWIGVWWARYQPDFPVMGLTLIGCGFLTLMLVTPVETNDRILRFGLPAAVILIGSLLSEKLIFAKLPARWGLLGDASYSIYIWHNFAVSGSILVVRLFNLPFFLGVPISIFGACVVGVASYNLIELRLTRKLRRRQNGQTEYELAEGSVRLSKGT